MRTKLARAGDRLLGRMLPRVTAGACVDVAYKCCSRAGYRFDCNGICRRSAGC